MTATEEPRKTAISEQRGNQRQARWMDTDSAYRGALGLAAEEDVETSQALLYFARNITGLMTGLELKLRIVRP
jgi:hypothetical protein